MTIKEEVLKELREKSLFIYTDPAKLDLIIDLAIKKCQEQKAKQVEELQKKFGGGVYSPIMIKIIIDEIFKEKK